MFLHPITWPNGKLSAASITFDIDADSLVHVGRPKDSELRHQLGNVWIAPMKEIAEHAKAQGDSLRRDTLDF